MSALKDALKSTTTSSKSNSSKNPAYYSREKNLFINDMATDPDEIVRVKTAGNEHVPAGTLKQMIETETDIDVLRVILMNPRTPLKAVNAFTDTDRALAFEGDEEVTEYLKARVGSSDEASE